MDVLRFDVADDAVPITDYESSLASSIEFAEGVGEAHAYITFFELGGAIGPHEAGFGQILFAVSGSGWVTGSDGVRVPLAEGHAAFIRRGEIHAKGSETGMKALIVLRPPSQS
jgi:quercetin dioxygenase-like cupin family protein